MQLNIFTPSFTQNSLVTPKIPNFGIAYKEFARAEFKPLAKELEGRVGIHCLKTFENVHVVFATVPGSTEENYCLAKYGAKHIQPLQAKAIMGRAVEIIQSNFGKLISEVEVPFVDTKQGMNTNTRRAIITKKRIESFTEPQS